MEKSNNNWSKLKENKKELYLIGLVRLENQLAENILTIEQFTREAENLREALELVKIA